MGQTMSWKVLNLGNPLCVCVCDMITKVQVEVTLGVTKRLTSTHNGSHKKKPSSHSCCLPMSLFFFLLFAREVAFFLLLPVFL
mmetsp:Transcript_3596/g.13749  ORF Transcript_3596/g.13749 Transcript_3596/m.13749 type:complete len:83 (+) Transcript_3596:164-412(+)